jgi:hypothetical protein
VVGIERHIREGEVAFFICCSAPLVVTHGVVNFDRSVYNVEENWGQRIDGVDRGDGELEFALSGFHLVNSDGCGVCRSL